MDSQLQFRPIARDSFVRSLGAALARGLRRLAWGLVSPVLGTSLVATITVALVLGDRIPQSTRVTPAVYEAWLAAHPRFGALVEMTGLSSLHSSWWFLALVLLAVLNLTWVIGNRAMALLENRSNVSPVLGKEAIFRLPFHTDMPSKLFAGRAMNIVSEELRGRGFAIARASSDALLAQKGKLGAWGGIVFHLSLVVMLLGVFKSASSNFAGVMVLVEGQRITEARASYATVRTGRNYAGSDAGFQVKLERFQALYDREWRGRDYAAQLTFWEEGRKAKEAFVRVNQPFAYQGTTFLLENYDFSPFLVVRSSDGKEIASAHVNLVTRLSGTWEDRFSLPGTGMEATVRFYPDFSQQGAKMGTKSPLPQNPALHLRVHQEDSGKELFQGVVPLGGRADVGGVSLAFEDLRYWAAFRVLKDEGIPLLFGSLWLAILGLALRVMFEQKRIWACLYQEQGTTRLALGARAHQCNALLSEELSSLASVLERKLTDGSE